MGSLIQTRTQQSQEKNTKSESSSLIRAISSENSDFLCLLRFVISSKHGFSSFSHNPACFKCVCVGQAGCTRGSVPAEVEPWDSQRTLEA